MLKMWQIGSHSQCGFPQRWSDLTFERVFLLWRWLWKIMTAILHQQSAMPTAQLMTHPMMQSFNTFPVNGCHTALNTSYFSSCVATDSYTITVFKYIEGAPKGLKSHSYISCVLNWYVKKVTISICISVTNDMKSLSIHPFPSAFPSPALRGAVVKAVIV